MPRWDSDAQSPLSWSIGNRDAIFRLILRSSLDAIITIDQNGLILDWNGAAQTMFGWSEEEIFGYRMAEVIIPPRYRAAHEQGLKHFLETGEGPILGRRIELTGLRRNGEEFPVELTIAALQAGSKWLFTAFLRDITSRKLLTARLETQNSVLRILGAAPDLETAEQRILESICNMEEWHFGAYWEVRENSLECRAVHRKDRQEFPRFQERTLANRLGRGEGLPGQIWDAGKSIWVKDLEQIQATPWIDAAKEEGLRSTFGFPILAGSRTFGVFEFFSRKSLEPDQAQMDVSASISGQIALFLQRKEGEAVLRESEAQERRFRLLIENSSDGIAIAHADGMVAYVSEATEKLLGYPPGEIYGKQRFLDVHPEEVPEVERFVKSLLERPGAAEPITLRLRHKDGAWLWVHARVTNLIQDPLIGGLLINFRDITRLKQAEDQLRHVQRVEALEQMAGGIAHDYNNLLTAINGYGTLALEGLEPGSHQFAFLTEILKAGERAAALTRQLLLFSRKQAAETRIWNLNTILSDMEPVIRRLVGERVQFTFKPGQDLGGIKADRNQVEQMIMNLVLNARDAMPDGGRLTVETLRKTGPIGDTFLGRVSGAGPYTVLIIGDTGMGMTPEVKSRIFEPFFTTKEPGTGAGLGLSVVYGVVQKSSGDISVRSEPGKGTVFEIFLPEEAVPEVTPLLPGKGMKADSSQGHETILLAEDEEQVLLFSARVLESQGYTVLQAHNGTEALEWMDKEPAGFDLLISDLIMPDLGGLALATRLRTKYPGLPVLFISGYSESTVVHHEIADVGAAFLQKPFGPQDLGRKVREILDLAHRNKPAAV